MKSLRAFGLVVVGVGSVIAAMAAQQPVLLYAAFGHAFVFAVMAIALGPTSRYAAGTALTGSSPSRRRSKRSAFITLFHAATKSVTNFACASAEP